MRFLKYVSRPFTDRYLEQVLTINAMTLPKHRVFMRECFRIHAKGRGPPEAIKRFTTMIVANAGMADYLERELPGRVVREIKKLGEGHESS